MLHNFNHIEKIEMLLLMYNFNYVKEIVMEVING